MDSLFQFGGIVWLVGRKEWVGFWSSVSWGRPEQASRLRKKQIASGRETENIYSTQVIFIEYQQVCQALYQGVSKTVPMAGLAPYWECRGERDRILGFRPRVDGASC